MVGSFIRILYVFLSCLPSSSPTFTNAGSPKDVPLDYDCAIRRAAYTFGEKLRPLDAGIIFDALQLQVCGVTRPSTKINITQQSSSVSDQVEDEVVFRVKTGDSIHKIVDIARQEVLSKGRRARVVLSSGRHFLQQTLQLGAGHSGLTLTGEEGAVLSGGVPLNITLRPSARCVAITGVPGCLEADMSIEHAIPGLRQGARRLIRARYPNADPETSMRVNPLHGWITKRTKWGKPLKPANKAVQHEIVGAKDWPGVEWPYFYNSTSPSSNAWRGEGDWGSFFVGVGGSCEGNYVPGAGFWCANPPRGIAAPEHASGIFVSPDLLPNAFRHDGQFEYNSSGGIVHAWRPGHWFTNMWTSGKGAKQGAEAEAFLPFVRGGFQGAEGTAAGAEWWIENVMQELDQPGEWFHDTQVSARVQL